MPSIRGVPARSGRRRSVVLPAGLALSVCSAIHAAGRVLPAFACACAFAVVALACGPGDPAPTLELPPRPADAPGGAALIEDVRHLPLATREARVYAEIARGNVPAWLRELRPVQVTGEVGGRERSVTFWVTPDYLAVGSEEDYFLMPLSAPTAQRVADLAGAALPTPRMVDAIWASADLRLEPIRIAPDRLMRTVPYFERHDALVKAQRFLYDGDPGLLAAGHKLDVVVASGLAARPGAIALYGWHRSSGQPVQPLYIGSTDTTVAFSHGIRLVDREVRVDGERRDLWAVLRDPDLAPLLSRAGAMDAARYDVATH